MLWYTAKCGQTFKCFTLWSRPLQYYEWERVKLARSPVQSMTKGIVVCSSVR